MSDGIRSGVNWMRRNARPSASATVRTVNVFAVPGMPVSRQWPPTKIAIKIWSKHLVLANDDLAVPAAQCASRTACESAPSRACSCAASGFKSVKAYSCVSLRLSVPREFSSPSLRSIAAIIFVQADSLAQLQAPPGRSPLPCRAAPLQGTPAASAILRSSLVQQGATATQRCVELANRAVMYCLLRHHQIVPR